MTAFRSMVAALALGAGVFVLPVAAPIEPPATLACEGGVCEVCPLIAGAARGVAIGPITCLA